MKWLTFFLSFFLSGFIVNCQTSFAFTTALNRKLHDEKLKDTLIILSLKQPLSAATESEWMKAFWAMELMFYKTPETKAKLSYAWKNSGKLTEDFQRALLEVSYTLYPNVLDGAVRRLLFATSSPAVFIRAAEYLMLSKSRAIYTPEIENLLQQKFKNSDYVGLNILQQRLVSKSESHPLLKDIFSKNFLPGQTVVYSLQRRNRGYPGLVIIRKSDGTFLKNSYGEIFHAAQLARAITNYPFYITNGNTPQGIFRWTGFDTSTISYIGPTPNLQMVMPYEATPAVFFGDSALQSKAWDKELYRSRLPSSWKAYDGIYESFLAGATGRSEIIMHGTAINPHYYRGQTYFPQTPSLGCLCSYEEWDKDGKLINSNQQKIVDGLNRIGQTSGYVVVLNLDNKNEAVKLQEIIPLVR